MRSLNQGAGYLPKLPLNQKKSLIARFALAILLVALMAFVEGCSKKIAPEPSNVSAVDMSNRGIQEFSLPGTLQYGETVVTIDQGTYTLTVNVKPNASTDNVLPYIKLAAGATISPAIGQFINLTTAPTYRVTLPSGEVQNWKIKIVREKPDYLDKIFKENERVIFVGNSITHGGRYHTYIWLYYMTRFPNLRFTILNGGIAGDVISNINARLNEDIYAANPSTIVLSFGMNDSGYFQYLFTDPVKTSNRLVNECDSTFKLVTASLNNHSGIKKILMSGSPYDFTTKYVKDGGWQEKPATFERIVQLQKTTAQVNNWPFYDVYHPMDQLNKGYQKADPNFTLSGTDRIHPESDGHLVWAYVFLRNQGLKGLEVADFTVDATAKQVTAANNCKITNIAASGDNVSFDYMANALPFPVDPIKRQGNNKTAVDALKYIPFINDLNQEMIRVKNLKGNNYDLKIDGVKVGRFKATDLGVGINMALISTTPQYKQALGILSLNEKRGSTEREMRDYYVQVYDYARPNGITNDNDPASWAKMRELKKTNAWIDNGLYERGSNPSTRQAWQASMDKTTNDIY
ncbi:MAG: hypothetical protein EOP47_26175, partial [Sphingobacteriaceae bacterium]